MIKFPYGQADFHKIRTRNYFYIDRTRLIPIIEKTGDALLFLRPRRFGKSLLLSMLENYYDAGKSEEFERLFGNLDIGKAPTALRNRYFVLKWNFSEIDSSGDVRDVRRALHDHVNGCIEIFKSKYRKLLDYEIALDPENCLRSLQSVMAAVERTPYGIYLLIDEYDNFANEVLMARQTDGRRRYETLVTGEGMLKTLFKAVKSGTEGRGIDRVFITGVSPVAMSDITSGFNIASNIYLEPEFNDLCGFHAHEISDTIRKIASACDFSEKQTADASEMMRVFYDGYLFSYDSHQRIYNPMLALYFLDHLQKRCAPPRKILDSNMAMDRNKLDYVASLPHGEKVVSDALGDENDLRLEELADRFGAEDILETAKDTKFMVSLLYFFGVLTLSEKRTEFEEHLFRIPNLAIRKLYVERLKESMLATGGELDDARAAAKQLYQRGEMKPLCEFVERGPLSVLSNRDYRWTNEFAVKTIFLSLLYNDTLYVMDSEPALRRRYADLIMLVRPDVRHSALLDILIEFKYVPLAKNDSTGEKVRNMSKEGLESLASVKKAFAEAKEQLADYRRILGDIYGDRLRLRSFAVVAVGFERLLWEEYED